MGLRTFQSLLLPRAFASVWSKKNCVRSRTTLKLEGYRKKTTKVDKTEWWWCVWSAEDQEDSGWTRSSSGLVWTPAFMRLRPRLFNPITASSIIPVIPSGIAAHSNTRLSDGEKVRKKSKRNKQIKTEWNGAGGGMCVFWLVRYLAFFGMALKVSVCCRWSERDCIKGLH